MYVFGSSFLAEVRAKQKTQARKTDRKMSNKYIFFYQHALFSILKTGQMSGRTENQICYLIKEFKMYCVLD